MKTQYENLLVLLGNSVNRQQNIALTEPVDWGAVLSYARFHKILPVILEAASQNSECTAAPFYGEYLEQATLATVEQTQKTGAFLQLYKRFNDEGVYPLVLKGLVCRLNYGELCDHRASGDEDLLISHADYEKTDRILKEQGFIPDFDGITATQAKTVREVLYTHPESPLRIEIHFNAIGFENDWLAPMNELFRYDGSNYREIDCGGIKIRTLNHTEHFLYLICHALKHFTFCGLGIRQITDILLYAKEFGNELNREFITSTLRKFDAIDICSDFFQLGNKYLGFDFALESQPICLDLLIEDLMESGLYGNETSARKASAHVLGAAMSNRKSDVGKISLLMHTVFSDRRRLVNMCPELEDKPHLIFREQCRRLGRFIRLKKERKSNLAAEGIALGKQRMELLKKYKLL